MTPHHSVKLLAPAKINLFLHVTGKRKDGYHQLQSLVGFADFGDEITITPADEFKFSFDSTSENLPIDENNLVICAANLLAATLGKDLNCHIHLSKNIPIGAGLGGGSSDAAATIRGLLQFWEASLPQEKLNPLLLNLGADVPACYQGQACYFEGIGEVITPLSVFPKLYATLIYPNKHCATQEIFTNYQEGFSEEISLPETFETTDELFDFILQQKNDLTRPAIQNIPDIEHMLHAQEQEEGCLLARMSGSGSACFGLFDTKEKAHQAAKHIKKEQPNWWARSVMLQ